MAQKRGSSAARKAPSENGTATSKPTSPNSSVGECTTSGRRKQNNSLNSILKVQHLQNLAQWVGGEASIHPLGALLGRRLFACREDFGITPDPSLSFCQRCEMILHPGLNCSIRIVKNHAKARRHCKRKRNTITKNNVIYNCHFCSYDNVKRGTLNGHKKDICTPKPKLVYEAGALRTQIQKTVPFSSKNDMIKKDDGEKEEKASTLMVKAADLDVEKSTTPASTGLMSLDSGKRKRIKSNAKKPDFSLEKTKQDGLNSRKRRKKGWTSLKEIAQSSARDRRRSFTNLSIPFNL